MALDLRPWAERHRVAGISRRATPPSATRRRGATSRFGATAGCSCGYARAGSSLTSRVEVRLALAPEPVAHEGARLDRFFQGAAEALTSMGIVSRELGRHEAAETLLLRSLEILKKVYGEDDQRVANALHELGVLYSVQGRRREAEPLFERALATLKATLGEGHPAVAETQLALAELRRDQGRPAEAEAFYRQALAVLEGAVGPGHTALARTRKSYSAFLRAQGREKEAAIVEAQLKENRSSS